jgi:lysophospholipase L1-like esterase
MNKGISQSILLEDMMKNCIYYVAMGDSLTEGVGASSGDASFAAKFFNTIKQTPACRFVNLGRAGMCSGELLIYMQEPSILEEWQKATHITVTIGGMDMIKAYQEGELKENFLDIIRHAIRQLKRNLDQILQLLRLHNPDAHVLMLGLYNPSQPENPLHLTANALLMVINNIYQEAANHYHTQFVDPFRNFLNRPHLLADEVHPNDLGHDVIADLMRSHYRQLVKSKS